MYTDPLNSLLARAAQGDAAASAAFDKARAARIRGQERFRAAGRAAAWRMIREAE